MTSITIEDFPRPGAVLVGDAFSVTCPATGTGVHKVLSDVVRLCKVHIPRWFSDDEMGTDKISEFYADEIRAESHASSFQKAFRARATATDRSLKWQARRWVRFAYYLVRGAIRRQDYGQANGHVNQPQSGRLASEAR